MNIIINKIKNINSEKQIVFFTLSKDMIEYEKSANTPILSGVELQEWLNTKINFYWYSILYKQYPDAPEEVRQSLKDIETWIAAGAWIPEVKDAKDNIIKPAIQVLKKLWKNTHPKEVATSIALENTVNDTERLNIIEEYLGLK